MWEEEGGRSKGGTRWWNDEVKEAVSGKKDGHKAMHEDNNSTEENKKRDKNMKNKANKAVSIAMTEKAEEALTG